MGRAKQLWIEQQEEEASEERATWIQEQLDDPEADESTPGWEELSKEYDAVQMALSRDFFDDWDVEGKTPIEMLNENISAAAELLSLV